MEDRMTKTTTVVQPTMLLKGLLTYLPIIFLLFTSNIMQTNTTGKRTPLMTWLQTDMEIKGAPGIRIIAAEIKRMEV